MQREHNDEPGRRSGFTAMVDRAVRRIGSGRSMDLDATAAAQGLDAEERALVRCAAPDRRDRLTRAFVERRREENAAPAPRARPRYAGRRVLIVDDEPAIRALLGRHLSKEGCTVTTAASAEHAAEILRAQRFDLVLTDVVMPGATGEAVGRIAAELQPTVPVIYMSGYVDLLLASRATVLEKPYSSQAIQDALDTAFALPATTASVTGKLKEH